jgi:hypothetical protein
MFNMQNQIKNNSADLQSYVKGVYEFTADINEKEKRKDHKYKGTGTKQVNKPLPPVRNRGNNYSVAPKVQAASSKKGGNPKLDKETEDKLAAAKRDGTPMPDYYKAWDKFAAAIDEDEGEEIDTGKI